MEKYQVIMQDEYNNLYHIGFFNNLNDAVNPINEWLDCYPEIKKIDELKEYPSTLSMCFDTELETVDDEYSGVMIRGFIFE